MMDAWQLATWEEYHDVRRLGRKTRLPEQRRRTLWSIFDRVTSRLRARCSMTRSNMFCWLASHLLDRERPPFDFALVDEAQDVSVAQFCFPQTPSVPRPGKWTPAHTLARISIR